MKANKRYDFWDVAGRVLPVLLLLAAYVLSVGFFAAYGMHNLDADMSSELIYARLQNDEGTLLTDNWYYSSEIRTLSPVPFYQLTMLFTSSWHVARTLAIALILAGAAAVFLYMAKPLGLSAGGMYLAAIFMLPFSQPYAFAEVYGCMYQPYVAMTFAVFGLILRLPKERGRVRRLVLLALLGFWGGTVGVRMLMMCAAPLALTCALEAFWQAKDADTLRVGLSGERGWRLLGAALVAVCTVAGYALNVKLLEPRFDFVSYNGAGVISPDCDHVFGQLSLLLEFMGFRESSRLISLRGAGSMLALGVLALAFVCLAMQLGREKDRTLALFTLFSLAIGMVVNVVTDSWFVRYYMPAALLLIVMLDKAWRETSCRLKMLRVLVPTALVLVFMVQSVIFLREEQRTTPADYEQTADWLMERGLTCGYATFWNGAPLSEVTDGAIEIYAMPDSIWQDDWKRLEMNDFLQEKRHLTERPAGQVFVLLSNEEAAQPDVPYADRAHFAGNTAMGPVYVYESAQELYRMLEE